MDVKPTGSPSGVPLGQDEAILPDLADLCRIHDVGLELIERSHDVDDLLDRVLEEYQSRLAELPAEIFDPERGADAETAKKLRGLVMFASQAVALKARAEANARLRSALAEADTARGRLNRVLASLDAGILVVSGDGRVLRANPAALVIFGSSDGTLEGGPLPEVLRSIPAEGDLELRLAEEGAVPRVVLASRRRVDATGGDEVFLLSDVTERTRDLEEKHRLEKLAEVLRTLSVLSHKINNPLTALVGRSQLLKARAGADPAVVKAASVIEEAAMRIAELVRELAGVVKEGRKEALDKMLDATEHGLPGVGGGSR